MMENSQPLIGPVQMLFQCICYLSQIPEAEVCLSIYISIYLFVSIYLSSKSVFLLLSLLFSETAQGYYRRRYLWIQILA
jgi:hypothetical protein